MIVKEVLERLGNKVRFVFRNFPLTRLRPHAYQSALAVETAAAQGKFWEMYDFLFKYGQSLTDDNLKLSAAKLGLTSISSILNSVIALIADMWMKTYKVVRIVV